MKLFNPKKGGGGHIVPPLARLRSFWPKHYFTDAHSNCKFLNIRRGHFATIFRFVGFFGYAVTALGSNRSLKSDISENQAYQLIWLKDIILEFSYLEQIAWQLERTHL